MNKKIKTYSWVKGLVIGGGATLILVAIFGVLNEAKGHIKTVENTLYTYSNKSEISYEVEVDAETLYDKKTLGEGQNYLAPYTKAINVSFKDSYKGNKPVNIDGEYKIVSKFRGYNEVYEMQETKKITVWEKTKELVPTKKIKENAESYMINEQLKVDIAPYLKKLKKLSEEAYINIPGELIVEIQGTKKVETPKGIVELPITGSITIGLENMAYHISKDIPEEVQDTQKEEESYSVPANKWVIIGYSVLGVVGIGIIISAYILLTEYSYADQQKKRINRIYEEYSGYLVEVEAIDLTKFTQIYKVKRVTDLVKVADELEQPIMYIKTTEHVGTIKDVFYVVANQTLYCCDI